MPYGCAINEYSRGLFPVSPASYQPYSRSTAVSPKNAMFPLGFQKPLFCLKHLCGLPNTYILAPHLPQSQEAGQMKGFLKNKCKQLSKKASMGRGKELTDWQISDG